MAEELEIKTPGKLHVEMTSIIQSKEAKDLFYGRSKEESGGRNDSIVGVNGFSQRIAAIFRASRLDDPYADYFLLKVEQSFAKSESEINAIEKNLNLKKPKNQKLTYKSIDPIKILTSYSTVYANMAMQLLVKADNIFLLIHSLRHVASLTRKEESILLNGNRNNRGLKTIIRNCLLSQSGFVFTNINRKDFNLMTAIIATAYNKMEFALKNNGDDKLPDCIIDRTCRPEYGPNIIPNVDMNELMRQEELKSKKVKK